MSCNTCKEKKCCCSTPFRYKGVAVDCLGVESGQTYDSVIEKLADEICELNEGDKAVSHIAFLSSTGSPTNLPGQSGQIDTYVVWGNIEETLQLGTFEVRNGIVGVDGTDNASIIFTRIGTWYVVEDPAIAIPVDTTKIVSDGDTIEISFRYFASSTSNGSIFIEGLIGGGTPPYTMLATHTANVLDATKGTITITMSKSGTNMIGAMKFSGRPNVYEEYPITISDFFDNAVYNFNVNGAGVAEDSGLYDLIVKRFVV